MRNTIKIACLFALILLGASLFNACKKTNPTTYGNNEYNNGKTVVATIMGIVKDESGMPVENASVTAGGATDLTDANGLFMLKDITTPEHATTVKISKATYFNGYKTLSIQAGKKHTVYVSLMKKENVQQFNADNGGTITTGNGISITFPSNALMVKSSSVAFSGQAYVYMKKIDPTTTLGLNTMPGDLRGLTAAGGEERLLQSFGMLVAEIIDAAGNPLQLIPGKEATISVDVPTTLLGQAAPSIPLWYFDEVKGIWVEEGSATLQGGKYVGKVKHFSFWNCDTPAAAIQLEMTLQDQSGNPLSGYEVSLTNTANNNTRSGTTNSAGWVGGLVYPNATLTMNVYSYTLCGSSSVPIYTQTITTGAVAQNLGTIVVTIAAGTSTINGSVEDCLGNPLANSTVVVQPFGILITPNAAGQFTYSFPCIPSSPLTFYAYDLGSNVYGTSTATIVAGVNNIGVLSACGNISPFLNLVLTNTVSSVSVTKNFLAPADNITMDITTQGIGSSVTATSPSAGTTSYFYMGCSDTTIGSFLPTAVYTYGIGTFADSMYTIVPSSMLTYTSFPLFPGDCQGNFSINLIGVPSGDTYTAIGTFRAKRSN